MKTERTQIHFLSDVLVVDASLDLKVSNVQKLNFKVSIGVISGYVSTLLVGVKKVKNTL